MTFDAIVLVIDSGAPGDLVLLWQKRAFNTVYWSMSFVCITVMLTRGWPRIRHSTWLRVPS